MIEKYFLSSYQFKLPKLRFANLACRLKKQRRISNWVFHTDSLFNKTAKAAPQRKAKASDVDIIPSPKLTRVRACVNVVFKIEEGGRHTCADDDSAAGAPALQIRRRPSPKRSSSFDGPIFGSRHRKRARYSSAPTSTSCAPTGTWLK